MMAFFTDTYANHFLSPGKWELSNFRDTDINGLIQERRNSIANTLELHRHLSCTNPSIYDTANFIPDLIVVSFNKCHSHEWSLSYFNPLWPSNAKWQKRSGSTEAQVMACCLMAPSHYLNQCWLIISEVQYTFILGQFHKRCLNHQSLKSVWKLHIKISFKFPRGQWVKYDQVPLHLVLIQLNLVWLPYYEGLHVLSCFQCEKQEREREIQFIGLFEDRGHQGPYSPYKPFNHNLYIGIIIFPHIDNPQSTGIINLRKNQLK